MSQDCKTQDNDFYTLIVSARNECTVALSWMSVMCLGNACVSPLDSCRLTKDAVGAALTQAQANGCNLQTTPNFRWHLKGTSGPKRGPLLCLRGGS